MLLHLSDDLMFGSKVSAEARAQGFACQTLRTAQHVASAVPPATCLILDLANATLDLAMVRQWKQQNAGLTIIAYGSHVEVDRLKAAQIAGCDVVWPRSKFAAELATALPGWVHVKPTDA